MSAKINFNQRSVSEKSIKKRHKKTRVLTLLISRIDLCAVTGKWGYSLTYMDLFPTKALDQIKVTVISGMDLKLGRCQ